VYEKKDSLQAEYNKVKSSEKRFSDELKALQQKYDNLCVEFGKKTFIHEAEVKIEQLQETLTDSISEFKKLAAYTSDKVLCTSAGVTEFNTTDCMLPWIGKLQLEKIFNEIKLHKNYSAANILTL